ncbi:MAG: FAD-dependent oxidoreductase [Candidatus Bathyarchaeota archaeon]|nr:FAD-dependent oxidoreductase [Candidatus Bathyarchaeota archaeon]
MKFETQVKEIIPRTDNVLSFRFPRPAALIYKPGQYLLVTIKANEKSLTKPLSLSSSPTEKEHIEFTKKLTDSEFSNALRALEVGDWVIIDAPYGTFTFEGESAKIVLLAGGIGITPFMSICRYCTDKRLNIKVTLLYGNRSEKDIVFRGELEALERRNRNLKVVFILNEASDSWKGAISVIDAGLVKKEVPDYRESLFYACGPPPMIQAMEKLIRDLGLPSTQLKLEVFTGHT